MSTRIPIAQRLLSGEQPVFGNQDFDHPDYLVPWDDYVSPCGVFDIQVAEDLAMMQGSETGFDGHKFGPLYPPFPDMWMEWSNNLAVEGRNQHAMFACSVDQKDTAADADFSLQLFMTVDRSRIALVEHTVHIYLDEQGHFERFKSQDITPDGEIEWSDNLPAVMRRLIFTAMTALSLINCKNVTTAETGTVTLARNGTQKRRREPARTIRYNTIILPGSGSQHEGKPGNGIHRATALHRVRGHFKTFTAERPLLGQHVGTYWWGWQVRGNAEKGVVVSDYKLASTR